MSARDFLTQQQQQALDLFGEITAMGEDQDLCVQILQNHRWNVDEAVNSFMGVGLQQENDDDEGEVAAREARVSEANPELVRRVIGRAAAQHGEEDLKQGDEADLTEGAGTQVRWMVIIESAGYASPSQRKSQRCAARVERSLHDTASGPVWCNAVPQPLTPCHSSHCAVCDSGRIRIRPTRPRK